CLLYAVGDDDMPTLQVAIPGPPRPVYCHNAKPQMIEATGLPLGLFEDAEYDEFTFQAEAGDLFVFFSDGILDSTNAAGELFGRTRPDQNNSEGSGNSAEENVKPNFHAEEGYGPRGGTSGEPNLAAVPR